MTTTKCGDVLVEKLREAFPILLEEILSEFEELDIDSNTMKDLRDYYSRCLRYSVDGGKLARGITVIKAYQASTKDTYFSNIENNDKKNDKNLHPAVIMGWCIEWLQAFFLTADDVMDNSKTRRGSPCWFRVEGVTATNAINDAIFLEGCIYRIMYRHLRNHKDYINLLHIMHEVSHFTVIGQHLDTNAQPIGCKEVNMDRVSGGMYSAIVKHKTAFYSFYLPVIVGITLAGIHTSIPRIKAISMALGEYFQIQDDVLDCYADAEILGKVGTDIQEKKCTWLLVQVKDLATAEELKELTNRYGTKEQSNVDWVKALYRKYDLQAKYNTYEEDARKRISKMIGEVAEPGVRELLAFSLEQMYKRTK